MRTLIFCVVVVAALSGVAVAQEDGDDWDSETGAEYLPEGTEMKLPASGPGCPEEVCTGETIVLPAGHYLLTRDSLNEALAASMALEDMDRRLHDCEKRAGRLAGGGGSRLWAVVKGVALGAAGAALFASGVYAGHKLW